MSSAQKIKDDVVYHVKNNSYYMKDIALGFTACLSLYYLHERIVINSKRQRFLRQAQMKKQQLQTAKYACFEHYDELISSDTESLCLSSTATQLRQHVISGKLTCAQTVLVICRQTHVKNETLNALLEAHFDRAYSEAIDWDNIIRDKRSTCTQQQWTEFVDSKPLLGVPVSIKDIFTMKDSDCTIGLVRLCNQPYSTDGSAVQLIRDNGGIPYCKTNCPQLNMLPESINKIIGATNNPYNLERTVGGSSGGEAALVASHCSKLGVGTDIGGSLRIPASFSGCIAYKPSSRRSLQTGKALVSRDSFANKFGIVASTGPLASSMDDIVTFCKVLWQPRVNQHYDCYQAPIPFREQVFRSKKKLVIGYWMDDGWFTSAQCVQRALKQCVNVLQNEYEYELVPLPFNDGFKVLMLYLNYMGAESKLSEYMRALDNTEDLFPGFARLRRLQILKQYVGFLVEPCLKWFGEHRKSEIVRAAVKGDLSLRQFKDLCHDILQFKYEFWQWIDSIQPSIDCILCPTTFYPAPLHNFSANFTVTFSATFLQNILDCAAGSYGPVTFVRKDECHYNLQDLPEHQRDSYAKELDAYMQNAEGLPVGVQIFSKPYDDEVVLRVMNDLDVYFKNGTKSKLSQ